MKFDAVLTISPHDIDISKLAIDHLIRFAKPEKIFCITSNKHFDQLTQLNKELVLVDEDKLIPSVTLKAIKQYLHNNNAQEYRAGWYLQQFLKMAIARTDEILKHYLIWDADTILLKPLEFFSPEGQTLITQQIEYHAPYFETYSKLLGEKRNCNFSFISEHLMINKDYMRNLIDKISPDSSQWVWTILDSIEKEHLTHSGFSEFETYGNFVYNNYPESMSYRTLNSLREGSSKLGRYPNKYDFLRLARKYDYVSFERREVAKLNKIRWEKVKSRLYYFLKKGLPVK